MMHWKAGLPFEVPLPREQAMNENRKRASCADREIYAHMGSASLQRLVDKHAVAKPEMQSSSMAEKGFGDVMVPRRWSTHKKAS